MNTLQQMGIQQWRLRKSSVSNIENKPLDSAPFEPELTKDIEEPLISDVDNSAPPSGQEEVVSSREGQVSDDSLSELDWDGMADLLDNRAHCPSCNSANAILGAGNVMADWVFITDAPGSNDIVEQQLFSGREGQLYEAMLQALRLDRGSVYTTSIFKCAPTDNFSNSPQCDQIISQQVALVQPKVIVTFGEFTAQALLKSNEPLEMLRISPQQCFRSKISVIPTYGPRDILSDLSLKAAVWTDLKKAIEIVNGG